MRGLATIMALSALAACAAPAPGPPPPAAANAAPMPPQAPAAPSASDREAAVAGINALGIDLYKQVARPGENVFLSAPSLSTVLAMAYAGAQGATADEMARALRFTLPPARLHREIGRLTREAAIDAPGRKVTAANALWVQSGFAVERDFLATLEGYGAPPREADFEKAAPQATRRINDWVERSTAGRIKDLFAPGALHEDTRLVLTNAVYLKADWLDRFDPDDTRSMAFFLEPSGSVTVPFLNEDQRLAFYKGEGFAAVALPYQGEELSMLVFLPDAGRGAASLERDLTGASIERWMRALAAAPKVRVRLSLPKVKLQTRYQMIPALEALGMARAFRDGAEFGGITRAVPLAIDQVVHQTFLQIDEQGTEAAAATGVAIRVTSGPRPPEVVFRADRPFVFAIRDNRSGALLFLGRIARPSG